MTANDHSVGFQREVTRIALRGLEQWGFALAGSGAIREHGITDRPTEDVDLFTTNESHGYFDAAVTRLSADLQIRGFSVSITRRASHYARLHVKEKGGSQLDVDLGVDWRQNDPVRLQVGPVLSLSDAIGNKVSALYSRGEPRDYLDVDAIRSSGLSSDEELIAAAAERDPGFDIEFFARQLDAVRRISHLDVRSYGVTAAELSTLRERFLQWSRSLMH